jgi:hypothetical protein
MPIGVTISLIVFGALVVWGIVLARHKITERPSETSSHHESSTNTPGLGSGGTGGN